MTMNPNTELDTMMFFDAALEECAHPAAHRAGRCRQREPHGGGSGGGAERGWRSGPAAPDGNLVRHERRSRHVVIFEGGQPELLANVVAQIYAHLLQHPFRDPVGLAVYVELRYMTLPP